MRALVPILTCALSLLACGGPPPAAPDAARLTVLPAPALSVADTIEPDDAVAAIVTRYRDRLGSKLHEVLTVATADLTRTGEPSSALGLFIADLMRAELVRRAYPVAVFITNDGGLRAPIYKGDVTLGDVYGVMPFDNELVVVEVDGRTLKTICDHIARSKGEPVSGIRALLAPRFAQGIEIGDAPLDLNATYRVGTTDYLVEAGWMSKYLKAPKTTHTGVFMRDAIAEGLRRLGAKGVRIFPTLDDRLRLKR